MKQSILTEKMNAIYEAKTVEEAKAIFNQVVDESRINDHSRRVMKYNIDDCPTLLAVQQYATNSMFKFEGMGKPKINKSDF